MSDPNGSTRVPLEVGAPLWDSCFIVAPLVVVGTRETDGGTDFAPKHMVTPLSWENHFGFVCTPRHATYQNAQREGWFTVSFLRPDDTLLASLAAAPRGEDGRKSAVAALPTRPARKIEGGEVLEGAYLDFECELDRVVDGFGVNSLVAGRIVAASLAEDCRRDPERDDQDLLARAPLLAYLHPGRFARVDRSFSFPYHEGFSR